MVLLWLWVGLSLYVIPKETLQESKSPWKLLPPSKGEHREQANHHLSPLPLSPQFPYTQFYENIRFIHIPPQWLGVPCYDRVQRKSSAMRSHCTTHGHDMWPHSNDNQVRWKHWESFIDRKFTFKIKLIPKSTFYHLIHFVEISLYSLIWDIFGILR